MGEVYRARDTRLNREVAVKASSERFSERCEREARAIAALIGNFTIATVTATYYPGGSSSYVALTIPVTAPIPIGDVLGGHIYVEWPDISSNGPGV